MSFYSRVKDVLVCGNLELKFAKFDKLFDEFKDGKLSYDDEPLSGELKEPSYAKICKFVDIKDIKKYRSKDKKAWFLHSLAHIEYSAIDIALDACARFKDELDDKKSEFYADWLEVASDEIRHFKLINSKLNEIGHKYGDFVTHNGLFMAINKTCNNLMDRMAVIPRFMEANGLDANLHAMGQKDGLADLLEIIMQEEILHVKKGDKWFKWCCQKEGVKDYKAKYFDIILSYYPNSFFRKRLINERARFKAGFETDEIEIIKGKM
ncbi:MAG: ferritin-like domain-containing protein [Campylobacter sp.]|nr:ferritin-like domain-containing protein [Campylobacter sp.]